MCAMLPHREVVMMFCVCMQPNFTTTFYIEHELHNSPILSAGAAISPGGG